MIFQHRRRIRSIAGIITLSTLLSVKSFTQDPPLAPQVRLEARVLEWQATNSLDFDFAVEFERTAPGSILDGADLTLSADPTLGSAARIFFEGDNQFGTFDAVIEALETVSSVRILSQPSVILTSQEIPEDQINSDPAPPGNLTSKISNAVKIPYETAVASGQTLVSFTEYRDTGVTLGVNVPKVLDDLIVVDLHTTVSDLTGFITVGLNQRNEPLQVPTIDSRTIHNRIIIPDRMVFIAGLIKTTRKTERHRGIPFLSEMPLLRYLLANTRSSSEDTELVFLLKPEIIYPDTEPEGDQPG